MALASFRLVLKANGRVSVDAREVDAEAENTCKPAQGLGIDGVIGFHWSDHLASPFIAHIHLEDVFQHMGAVTCCTQRALEDTEVSLSLLNIKVTLEKSHFTKTNVSRHPHASSGRHHRQRECCEHTPGSSPNRTSVPRDPHPSTHSVLTIPSCGHFGFPALSGGRNCWYL